MQHSRHRTQSPVIKALCLLASDPGIAVITILTILGIYLFDTITPLGKPVWLFYLVPLALSYWSKRYYAIPAVCGTITIFLAAGLILSPQGISPTHAFVLRLAFFLFFICAGILLWSIRKRQIITENL